MIKVEVESMSDLLYQVFLKCFPEIHLSLEEFETELDLNDSTVVTKYSNDTSQLIGFSIIRKNCISMICVLPEYQNKGYGKQIMEESEKEIRDRGYEEVLLGYKGEKTSLFYGVPLTSYNQAFFSKLGYDSDFSVYDYEIEPFDIPKQDKFRVYSFPAEIDSKSLVFELLKKKDKNMYQKYALTHDTSILYSSDMKGHLGFCFYHVDDNHQMELYDLVAYPNFDVSCKLSLLSSLFDIAKEKECDRIMVKNVSNPIFYKEQCKGVMRMKYWRGSKAC